MDELQNLQLLDSYPEPQLQPTSHIQHYLATVRWMVARRSRGPTAANRNSVDVLQDHVQKVRDRAGQNGCGIRFFATIF